MVHYEEVTSFGLSCKEQGRTVVDSKGHLAGALLGRSASASLPRRGWREVGAGRAAVQGGFPAQVRGEPRSWLNLSIPLGKYISDRSPTSFSVANYGGFSSAAERNSLLQLVEGCFPALGGNGHLSLNQSRVFQPCSWIFKFGNLDAERQFFSESHPQP